MQVFQLKTYLSFYNMQLSRSNKRIMMEILNLIDLFLLLSFTFAYVLSFMYSSRCSLASFVLFSTVKRSFSICARSSSSFLMKNSLMILNSTFLFFARILSTSNGERVFKLQILSKISLSFCSVSSFDFLSANLSGWVKYLSACTHRFVSFFSLMQVAMILSPQFIMMQKFSSSSLSFISWQR